MTLVTDYCLEVNEKSIVHHFTSASVSLQHLCATFSSVRTNKNCKPQNLHTPKSRPIFLNEPETKLLRDTFVVFIAKCSVAHQVLVCFLTN
jgi:hypothetical protein